MFRAAHPIPATNEKAKDAFAATRIYSYRPNIIFDEDLEPPEIPDKMPYDKLEGTKDGHSHAGSSLRVDGLDLPTPAPHVATTRMYYSH